MPDNRTPAAPGEGDSILRTALGLGLLGAGQTQEHIQYGPSTQVWVQLLQAAFLIIAIGAIAGGLWLMAGPLLWLLELATTRADTILAAVLIALVTVGARAAARWLKAHLDQEVPPVAWFLLETIAMVALIFFLLELAHIAIDERWSVRDSGRTVAGLAITVASALLAWRFGNELFNPLFPKAPTTQILERMVDRLDAQGEPPTVVEVQGPIPTRTNGGPAVPTMPLPAVAAAAGQVEVRLSENYRRFADLVALVRRAQTHGLTREANVDSVKPRLKLPSGERLTRGRLQDLWLYGATWGLWRYDAAKGQTPEWSLEPDAALRLLEQAWALNQPGSAALSQAGNTGT